MRAGRWVAIGALIAGCGGDPRTTHVVPRSSASAGLEGPTDPCDVVSTSLARSEALVGEGRLHRATRVLAASRKACPSRAPELLARELPIHAELHAWGQVRALADVVGRDVERTPALAAAMTSALALADEGDVHPPDTDAAKAPMRDVYRRAAATEEAGDLEGAFALYQEAWALWHPNGQALVQAGLVASKLGRPADAQRLFDRGLAEIQSVTRDGNAVILETPNGFEPISDVAWSARGRVFVAHRNRVSVLNQSSLRVVGLILTDVPEQEAVTHVALTPDGKTAAIAAGGEVELYDAIEFRERASVNVGRVSGRISMSSDGGLVAVGALDGVVLWSPASGATTRLEIGSGAPRAVALSPDGARVAAALGDRSVRVWSVGSRQLVATLSPGKDARDVAFSPDGASLAVAWEDAARLYRADGGAETGVIAVGASRVAFSRDGAVIATSGAAGVATWDARTRERRSQLAPEHLGEVWSLGFSPDDGMLVSSGGAAATLSDAATGAVVRSARAHVARVDALTLPSTIPRIYLPDRLARRDRDLGVLRRWDPATGETTDVLATDPWGVIALAPSGDAFATVRATERDEKGRDAWLSDLPTRRVERLVGHTASVESLAFSADGSVVASGSSDATVRLWDASSAKVARTIDTGGATFALAFAPDGKTISGGGVGGIRTWRTEDGGEQARLSAGLVTALAYSRDGAWLAAGDDDGRVEVWDVAGGKRGSWSRAAGGAIVALALSPDGKLLASAAKDGSVDLWRAPKLDRLAAIRRIEGADAAYVVAVSHVEILGTEPDAARDVLACRVGPLSLPFAVCRERFEIPGLLARAIAGDPTVLEP